LTDHDQCAHSFFAHNDNVTGLNKCLLYTGSQPGFIEKILQTWRF
jgi:hypothetical protein